MLLNLLAITVIVVFINDLSGFQYTIKKMIWRWLKGNKPFQDFEMKIPFCSLCMSHHCMVIWLLCTGQFSLIMWMVVCLISFNVIHIKALLEIISDVLTKAENKINDIL